MLQETDFKCDFCEDIFHVSCLGGKSSLIAIDKCCTDCVPECFPQIGDVIRLRVDRGIKADYEVMDIVKEVYELKDHTSNTILKKSILDFGLMANPKTIVVTVCVQSERNAFNAHLGTNVFY